MPNDFYIEALDSGDTAWRIDWFGNLAFHDRTIRWTRPSICVVISAVAVEPEFLPYLTQLSATIQQRQIWLSIGLLTVLRVGDVWKSGKLFLTPDHELETFSKISINRDSVSRIKAGVRPGDADFFLPLRQHPWHELHTKAFCVVVSLPNEQQLVVPCWELIRFYFGSSANLLSRLVKPGLETRSLYKKMHHNALRGHMYLELAEGIAGGSATDIARMAGSPEAWQSAVRISTSCLAASSRAKSIYPSADFPFEGQTTLVAAGKWLMRNGCAKATFVVFSLRSCSHPFPFKTLNYRLDRSRITTLRKPVDSDATEKEKRFFVPAKKQETRIREEDPGRSKAPKTLTTPSSRKFPDLEKKEIWRSSPIAKDSGTGAIIAISPASDQNWAATGDPVSSRPIRAIDISEDHAPGSDRVRAGIPGFVKDALLSLSLPAETKIEVLYPADLRSPVFLVPTVSDEDGVIPDECFFESNTGEQRPRHAAAVMLDANISLKNTAQLMVVVEPKRITSASTTGQVDWSADRALTLDQLSRYATWTAVWGV